MSRAGPGKETDGIDDPATRARLTPDAIAGFLGVAARWGLSLEDRQALLGDVDRSTVAGWQRPGAAAAPLSVEVLTRISLVLAIYEGLERVLRHAPAEADAWIRRPNLDTLFGGRSPLDVMRDGGLQAMSAVRRYVDEWTGGPPAQEARPGGGT